MEYAVFFGGQGCHCPEMFDIIKKNQDAFHFLEITCEYLNLSLPEIDKLISSKILENTYSQPLLCAYSYAVWKTIEKDVPKPAVFAGFSLGELAAYGCADSFNFETLLKSATHRAQIMESESPENIKVIAVMGLDLEKMKELCLENNTEIMIVSEPEHFSVAGYTENIKKLCLALKKKYSYAEIRNVAVNVPSHTKFLLGASAKFKNYLEELEIKNPGIPVIAGIDGRLVRNKNVMIRTLSAQIKQTVMWHSCYENAVERGAEVFLEISPGNILTKIIKRNNQNFMSNSTSAFSTIKGIADWINKYCR